jgi:hypothetical protein
MNDTQRRMLVEMQRLTELIDRANARMDAILPGEALMSAAGEIAQLAKEIQTVGARLAFLSGDRHMARVLSEAGLAIASDHSDLDGNPA